MQAKGKGMKAFAEFARQLADASAQIIRPYFRAQLTIDFKGDHSPVTIADKKAEEVMRELIMQEFPAHGILGEEFGHYQSGAEYQWILDPIDGTKNFIVGTVLFGTLIALLQNGNPILGVINQPILGDFLIGLDGETQFNDRKVEVRPCSQVEDATLLVTGHWEVHKHQDGAAFDALARRARLYRTWGDCYGYTLLATGFADIALDPVMHIWDVAPLVPIVEGAGGKITDWHGNAAIGGRGVIATAGPLHDTVVQALNPANPG
jgi:histidinol phosphatase-like enzyme (inositol monophosphatase family)